VADDVVVIAVTLMVAGVATPPAFTTTKASRLVLPDANWTVPAGLLPSAAVTLAVSVTVAPDAAGLGLAVRVVTVCCGVGATADVVYVPLALNETKTDCTSSLFPVALGPL